MVFEDVVHVVAAAADVDAHGAASRVICDGSGDCAARCLVHSIFSLSRMLYCYPFSH